MENIVYYLALFLLVFGIRFFKLKKLYKENFSAHLHEVLHVSLDLVYTASGIVIALLLNIGQSWLGPVLIIYLLFVIFSALIEMAGEDEFSLNSRTLIHGIIVSSIIILSVLSYTTFIPKVDINGVKVEGKSTEEKKTFEVIVPFRDLSLERHLAKNELRMRRFFYSEIVNGIMTDSLINTVVDNLKLKEKPIYENYQLGLEIIESEIVINELCNLQLP